jgi:hypothetical protein
MPYKVSKSGGGYKVKNKKSGKTYSKKPMSKEKAKKQMAAIYANTNESILHRIDATLESYAGLPDGDEFGKCSKCGSRAEEARVCGMCGSTMLKNYPPDGITVCSDCGATEDTNYAIVCVNCNHAEPIAESYDGLPDEDDGNLSSCRNCSGQQPSSILGPPLGESYRVSNGWFESRLRKALDLV